MAKYSTKQALAIDKSEVGAYTSPLIVPQAYLPHSLKLGGPEMQDKSLQYPFLLNAEKNLATKSGLNGCTCLNGYKGIHDRACKHYASETAPQLEKS